MGLVRILIDGYSLLHQWPQLARGKPRHSEAARAELIHWLRQYQDAIGTPITVFFDGARAPAGTPKSHSTPELEVIFSTDGHTADDLIERTAHRLSPYGEVLVVTDDNAEKDTVISFGAATSSCQSFILTLISTLEDLQKNIRRYNESERRRFNRPSK